MDDRAPVQHRRCFEAESTTCAYLPDEIEIRSRVISTDVSLMVLESGELVTVAVLVLFTRRSFCPGERLLGPGRRKRRVACCPKIIGRRDSQCLGT